MAGQVFKCSVQLTREQARQMIDAAMMKARALNLPPLTLVVLTGVAIWWLQNVKTAAPRFATRWPKAKRMPHWASVLPAALLGRAMQSDPHLYPAFRRLPKAILSRLQAVFQC